MSYYKITDPAKRDKLVEEYLSREKRVRKTLRDEQLQRIGAEKGVSEFFKPVTDSQTRLTDLQAKTLSAIEEQRPLLEGALDISKQALEPVRYTSTPWETRTKSRLAYDDDETEYHSADDSTINLSVAAQHALTRAVDGGAFGMKGSNDHFKIGDKEVKIGSNTIKVGDKEYKGTHGLYNLLTQKKIKSLEPYTEEDKKAYSEILLDSGAIWGNNHPGKPASSRSVKYKNVVGPLYEKYIRKSYKGGAIFLSSDPNVLVKRLNLLMASAKAGNNGVVNNEIVAILDELLRLECIDRTGYKNALRRLK